MKNMKRKALIVAVMALLLVAILAMSVSTFAKYTTTTNISSNSAAVAKWGFAASIQANDMFGDAYGAATSGVASKGTWVANSNDAGTLSVKATSEGTEVVAPGTKGSMTFSITGTAEVLAQITVTVDASSDVYLTKTDGNKTYNPIKWTLKKDGAAVSGCENTTLSAITGYIEAMDELVDPAESYSKAGNYEISWVWALNNSADMLNGAADSIDAADTMLGQAAISGAPSGYTVSTTVTLNFSIEITQTQK